MLGHTWVVRALCVTSVLVGVGCAATDEVQCENTVCAVDAGGVRDAVAETGETDRGGFSDTGIARDVGRPGETVVSLALLPDRPVVQMVDGARTVVPFEARVTLRDGTSRRVSTGLRFSVDDTTVGVIDEATGEFVAAGAGGQTTVRVATVDGTALTANTVVTVNVVRRVLGDGVTEEDRARAEGMTAVETGAETPTVDYPLEAAVMPRNVAAPSVMWTPRHRGASAMDLYIVKLTRTHATLEVALRATRGFRHEWTPPREFWARFAESDLGDPVEVRVTVANGSRALRSSPRRFRTIDAVIAGSVYYWSPPRMRLTRLDVDTSRRVDFLPNPGSGCIGCHAVSRDGQRLAGFLENPGEDLVIYDLARDLTGNPAPNLSRTRAPVRRCVSFNPDATRLVSGDCGANPSRNRFSVIDVTTGADVRDASPGDGFDPEWSPDGRSIAFTNRSDDLALTAVMPGDRYGAPRVIHRAESTPGGTVDWHPTWSPSSAWIVFQHGANRRTAMGAGDLWIIAREGGAPTRLDNANGGAAVNTYRPVFSPFDSGGYFWLLFTTPRAYGNATAGTRNVKQIWVSALRNRPVMGTDPSEVPYYLPGQEVVTVLSPYWAPAPCRPTGRACSMSAECCSGECEPDSMGQRMCVPPRTACHSRGQMCGGASDCCSGLVCTPGRVCDLPSPG